MKKNSTIIVNFYGGPGAGKSTIAAATFANLKLMGVNAELALEYAKDLVWQESFKLLENQMYVFSKQYNRIHRLLNKVDVVITDSPLLLSLFYGKNSLPEFKALVKAIYRQMNNYDIFIKRVKYYNPIGRIQTESEAKKIDNEIEKTLNEVSEKYEIVNGNSIVSESISKSIFDMLKLY